MVSHMFKTLTYYWPVLSTNVQCIIPQVGGSSDFMCGDSQQEFLIVSQVSIRQDENAIMFHTGLQRHNPQLLQLEIETECVTA